MTPPPDFHIDTSSALSVDSIVDVWRRRKWIGIVVCIAVSAAAIAGVLSLPNLYRASATVLVERPRISEAFVRQSVTAELETRIQTIHREIMSRTRLSEVISRLGLYAEQRGLVPMDALVERLRREAQLNLQGVEQSTGRTETIAFTLSYSGRDPEVVARVANTLAAFYIEGNSQNRERQAAETAEFLQAQLADTKRELDQQEKRANAFKQRRATELQQVEVGLTALERLNTQLRLNNESQLRAIERRERLELQLAAAESTPAPRPPDGPAARLTALRGELTELRRQYSDRYPEVIRVQAQIAALERDASNPANGHGIAAAPAAPATQFARQALANVENELRALKDNEASLRTEVATYEARVDNAPRQQEELDQPSRDYDAVNERYQALMKRAEDARLAENLERGKATEQFRILDPAIPPLYAAAPNRLYLMIMGVIAAFSLGVAAIVVVEKFDTSFHTADELQAFTNLPMLARIRLIPTAARARRARLQVAVIAAAALIALALMIGGSYYVAGGNEQIVRMTARPAL
jgi:polysaccharide chain length determinant protein (PEP-CTERM system associated)